MTTAAVLSQQQQAMTDFTATVGRGLRMYWEHLTFPLPTEDEVSRAEHAITSLVGSHSALRYTSGEDGVERDAPPAPIVTVTTVDEARERLGSLQADSTGPLLRSFVLAPGVVDAGAVLWVAVHHLVTDGVSQSVITDHVRAVLAGRKPTGSSDYEQFAVAQQEWWPTARSEYASHFGRIKEAEWSTGIVGRTPGVHDARPSASWYQRELDVSPAELRQAGGTLRATATAISMAAWAGSALAHVRRPVIATHTAGRPREARTSVGYFANALLLAPVIPPGASASERVHTIRDEILAGADHQRAHVDTVAREVLGRDAPYTMLFTVVDERRARSATPRGAASEIVPPDDATRRDLCVYVSLGDVVSVDVLYRTAAYDRDAVRSAVRSFNDGLSALLAEARRENA